MKKFLKKLKSNLVKTANNERGQGMLEYILLLVVIVGLVLALKGPLTTQVDNIKGKLSDSVNGILGN